MSADLIPRVADLGADMRRERVAVTADEIAQLRFTAEAPPRRRRPRSALLAAAAALLVVGGGLAVVDRLHQDSVATVAPVEDGVPYVVFDGDELGFQDATIMRWSDGTILRSSMFSSTTSSGWLDAAVVEGGSSIFDLLGTRPRDAQPIGTVEVFGNAADVYRYFLVPDDGPAPSSRRRATTQTPDCFEEHADRCAAFETVDVVVEINGYVIWFGTSPEDAERFAEWLPMARFVDRATWEQQLPDGYLHGATLAAELDRLAGLIPTPDGAALPAWLDAPAAVIEHSMVPQMYASGAACAWTEQWLDAVEAGDDTAAAGAVEALRDSRSWPGFAELTADSRDPMRVLVQAVVASADGSPADDLQYETFEVRDGLFVFGPTTVELPITHDSPLARLCTDTLGA